MAFSPVETRHVIPAVAIPIAMFGVCDIADGWLSWRTSTDRGWRKLRKGKAARAFGLARAAFGIASVTVAVVGLLAYGELDRNRAATSPTPSAVATRQ